MKYSKKQLQQIIRKIVVRQVSKSVRKKFEHKNIKDNTKRITQNSKLLYQIENLQLDFDIQTFKNQEIKSLIGKELSDTEAIKLCKVLKDINFKFEYACNYGYCVDFFNFFTEVTYSVTKKRFYFLLSDKILLARNIK
jgi:hypothetical protein